MGRVHLRALSASDVVRVVAVADPSVAARDMLHDAGVELHADAEAMLRAAGLDGVLVAAPSTLHLSLVAQIAAAGLPILCEKPCGITADQAREAAEIAERHAVKLQVAYWRRFVPALQRLRQRIADGELGALYFLACYQWDGEPPSARFDASSGGIFVDMGVHEFDQIRWLSGQEFSRARCRGGIRHRRDPKAHRRCACCRAAARRWCRSADAFPSAMSAASRHSARATPRTAGSCGRRTVNACSSMRCGARRKRSRTGCAAARPPARQPPMRSRHLRARRAGRGADMTVRTRHQSDHLDQRRHAGTRRRHSARDVSRRDTRGRLQRHRTRRQVSPHVGSAGADPGAASI